MTVISALLLVLLTNSYTPLPGDVVSISGVVTDANGDPLVGATVMVVGTTFGWMTGEDGRYFIINLEPGLYELHVGLIGFTRDTLECVEVAPCFSSTEFGMASELNVELVPEIYGEFQWQR